MVVVVIISPVTSLSALISSLADRSRRCSLSWIPRRTLYGLLCPQPRYLFDGCCATEDHCTIPTKKDHVEKMMGSIIHLRDTLKKRVGDYLKGPLWITDSCRASNVKCDRTARERAESLQAVSAPDGVHLKPEGYHYYAKSVSILFCMGMVDLIFVTRMILRLLMQVPAGAMDTFGEEFPRPLYGDTPYSRLSHHSM